MRPSIQRSLVLLALAMAIVAVVVSACVSLETSRRSDAVPEDLQKVWEVYEALQQRYVGQDQLDPDELAEGAIRGMLETLDDPFTAYFDQRAYEDRVANLDGSFEGIGATVAVRDGDVTIVSPYPDSPAAKAGLREGDVIREVEGESIAELSLQQVVDRIRGPKGTPIAITIQRAGSEALEEVTVVRADIVPATVETEMLAEGLARVRITQFVRQTGDALESALKTLRDQGADGVILDLRGNPGGLLTSVIDVTSHFLDGGLVMYEMDASGHRTDWKARDGGEFTEGALVVLVDGASASGSEVVAGALQARQRGTILGTQTFGKGVVNVPVKLDDGSGLYISTSRWYTPAGQQIDTVGITPDVFVPRTLADIHQGRDPQLQRAIEIIQQNGAPVRAG